MRFGVRRPGWARRLMTVRKPLNAWVSEITDLDLKCLFQVKPSKAIRTRENRKVKMSEKCEVLLWCCTPQLKMCRSSKVLFQYLLVQTELRKVADPCTAAVIKWKKQCIVFCSFFLPTVFFCVLFGPPKDSKHISSSDLLPGQWNQRPNCRVWSWYLSWFNLIHCLKASLILRVGTGNMAGAAYTGFLSRFVGWVQFANFKTAKSLVRKKSISAHLVLVWVYTPPCFVSHVEDWKVCACSREKLQIMDPLQLRVRDFRHFSLTKTQFWLVPYKWLEDNFTPWYFYPIWVLSFRFQTTRMLDLTFWQDLQKCSCLSDVATHPDFSGKNHRINNQTGELNTCKYPQQMKLKSIVFRSLKASQDGKRRFEFVGEWRRRGGGLPDSADYTRGFCFLNLWTSLISDD